MILHGDNRKIPRFTLTDIGAARYSIHPEFHTRLFPDSILRNETFDVLVIYRTNDRQGPAWYRSVATSICVVDEVKVKHDFRNADDFVAYCRNYSVFSESELRDWYNDSSKRSVFAIKMTYNIALARRLTRKKLIEDIGLDQHVYWGFMPISKDQFKRIAEAGGIDESFIIYQA